MPTIIACTTPDEFITKSTAFINQYKNIGLSGGSTPKPVYENLTNHPGTFFQVDERYVPADHTDSNQHMIRQAGLHVTAFDTSLPIEECLSQYEIQLPNHFDLCVMGMGNDGHTASLFPHSPALHATTKTAHTVTDSFAVRDRLTLTFLSIMESRAILLLIKNKPEALHELLHGNKSVEAFPTKKLLEHDNLTIISL